jgi:ribokinase
MTDSVSLVVAGPVTIDLVLGIDAMPSAAGSAVANEMLVAAGGKGANPAVTAAKLGASVRLIGAVGDDPQGREAIRQLRGDGIDVDAVTHIPGAMTGQIVHLVERHGRRRYIEHPGANDQLRPRPRDVAQACRDARVVVISTAIPADALEVLVAGARDADARVVADLAGPRETSAAILGSVDIVRGDATEVGEIIGCHVNDFASATDAARRLCQRGPSIAIVQAGEEGNVIVAGDHALSVSHAPVTVVDPTGGGDAFIAAFAVALGRDQDLTSAALLATAVAGHTVSHLGGRPTFTDEAALWTAAERCAVSEGHAG